MGIVELLNFVTMRRYAIIFLLGAAGLLALLPGCKTVQTVRCAATSFKPVVVIGLNGSMTTIFVPFCDTLQVVPKVPDTLRLQ